MSKFRITDGKGFGMSFANGWRISVQWGYGNYCSNYDGHGGEHGEDFRAKNICLGAEGSNTAECAAINPAGDLVELPAFMFADEESYRDKVSNRSTPEQVLALMNWVSQQPATTPV